MMSFLVAWQLLTAIPTGHRAVLTQEPGRSMAWFPLVGLVIGAILVILDFLLAYLLPPLPRTALLLIAWVALTGGLHLDGLIDCCDGLLVAKSAAQRLEIMKDSRVGAFGVVGAICLLLAKFSALAALAAPDRAAWLLVLPATSRWAIVWAAWRYPLARPDGVAAWFRQGMGGRQVLIASVLALFVAILIRGAAGAANFVVTWFFALFFAAWVQRRIPGLTGDVYGALNELSETLGLLVAVIIAGRQ